MTTQAPDAGWLAVSTDGFAEQNAARPPEHLVKELVQNALDALSPNQKGKVKLTTEADEKGTWIHCEDSGCGIADMENLRTVFWTSKQDSHLKRGRMGRGFKEMLCLALHCEVLSRKSVAAFATTPSGRRIFTIQDAEQNLKGTRISMLMPWNEGEIAQILQTYFTTFLLPENVTLDINGKKVPKRLSKYQIEASLTTEAFESGRWLKPSRKTTIELVPLAEGEKEGLLYEMGIPICPVEWDAKYHANILQRVPMNPNRDAVMSGYAAKVHRACLTTLLAELSTDETRAAWVGEAAHKTGDENLQKTVLEKAFGNNLARSVPKIGKYDHDADASEHTGATILHTKQLSGGFKEMARTHIPTSLQVAEAAKETRKLEAAQNTVDLNRPENRAEELITQYGKAHVQTVVDFAKWICEGTLETLNGEPSQVNVRTALMADKALATWSENFSILTLALDHPAFWNEPLKADTLGIYIHETAHELAFHHGSSFSNAMQRTGGACAQFLFEESEALAGWKKKLSA